MSVNEVVAGEPTDARDTPRAWTAPAVEARPISTAVPRTG